MQAVARRIAQQIAARHADAVDREARFPSEAIAALRSAGLLGAAIPLSLGGLGLPFSSIVSVCYELGQCCASTAMVFSMHQIQVACLVRHSADSSWHRAFLSRVAASQLLLASATTEAGSGGDVRRSECAVSVAASGASIAKAGCVISYAEHADALLATARRNHDSAPSDQVAVLAERAQYRLELVSGWDALGMRGTSSQGYNLALDVTSEQILPASYADISSQTMLPVSHITWAALWLGIATSACQRARGVVRRRTIPGALAPAGALRLSQALIQLQAMRAQVAEATRRYENAGSDPDMLGSIAFALSMNHLKIAVSTGATQIVSDAMLVIGLAGYRNDSPDSLGRHLRDAHSAALMISNDRILGNCAMLLAGYRGEDSLFS